MNLKPTGEGCQMISHPNRHLLLWLWLPGSDWVCLVSVSIIQSYSVMILCVVMLITLAAIDTLYYQTVAAACSRNTCILVFSKCFRDGFLRIKKLLYWHVCNLFHRIKIDSTYRAFGCHCSLHQYDVISRWCWKLTGRRQHLHHPVFGRWN